MTKPLTICIIDDDEIYKFTFTKTIENQGLARKILTFSDGEEALDFIVDNLGISDNLPDIIFLDSNMPIMDGFEFIEEYAKLKPRVGKNIIIYMVTSSVDPVDIDRSQQFSEISDYLTKPIKPDQLSAIVDELEKKGQL